MTTTPFDPTALPPFDRLPEDKRQELIAEMLLRRLSPGEVLFYSSQEVDFAYLVQEGALALIPSRGPERLVPEGRWIGLEGLNPSVPGSERLAAETATARSVVEVWTLDREAWIYYEPLLAMLGERPGQPPDQPPPAAEAASRTDAGRWTDAGRTLFGLFAGLVSGWLVRRPAQASAQTAALRPRRRSQPIGAPVWLAAALGLLLIAVLTLGSLAAASFHRLVVSALLWGDLPAMAQSYLELTLNPLTATSDGYDMLGRLLLQQGDLAGAADRFQQAVNLDNEDAVALNNLAVAELALAGAGAADSPQRLQSAVAHLQKAADLDPSGVEVLINLGNAEARSGDLAEAMAAYNQAYQVDPTHLEARTRYAAMLVMAGSTDEARRIWLEVLGNPAASQSVQVMAGQGLGVLMVNNQDASGAIPYIEAAKAGDPKDCLTRLYLGMAYEGVERLKAAGDEYSQALILCPMSPVAGEATARLLSLLPRLEGR